MAICLPFAFHAWKLGDEHDNVSMLYPAHTRASIMTNNKQQNIGGICAPFSSGFARDGEVCEDCAQEGHPALLCVSADRHTLSKQRLAAVQGASACACQPSRHTLSK